MGSEMCIRDRLLTLVRMEWSGRVETKQEECEKDDEHFHLLYVIHTLRHTQVETRREFMRDIIRTIPESVYDQLTYCPSDGNEPDPKERQDEHDVLVDGGSGEDSDDDVFDDEELKGDLDFLAGA